jgi:hypothetical protein
VSPIYEHGDPFSQKLPVIQGPKLLRDRLYDRMVDWDFHSVEELDGWMQEREWVKAMCDLTFVGFTFDRLGSTFRLRKRRIGEPKPSIVDLLSGATLPLRLGDEAVEGIKVAALQEEETKIFSPVGSSGTETPEAERMVLDEDETMILSAFDFVTDTCAILARKGRGKTYLAMLIAEQMLLREVPFVVVDPTGCWGGLLSNVDGSPADNRLVLLGGGRGHYPLTEDSGRATARMVVGSRPLSFVLDLSEFGSEEQHLFVADFADELYRRNRSAIHVFVDEADIFAPQKCDGSSKHQKRCLTALDNLTRRGRFKGIGDTLISQRPAVVNKNLLTQVGSMFFLQMSAPQDLAAVASWLHENIPADAKESCRSNLPVLAVGVSYYLRGGDEFVFRRFKVKTRSTFDSSRTPKHGEVREEPTKAELSEEDKKILEECHEAERKGLVVEQADRSEEKVAGEGEAVAAGSEATVQESVQETVQEEVSGFGDGEPIEDTSVLGFEDRDTDDEFPEDVEG